MASFLTPLIRDPRSTYRLRNQRSGAVLAERVLTAFDSETRRTGLLKHATFPEGEALVIAPTSAIHTFFMKFPIDVVFVGRDGRVLKLRSRVAPWRIAVGFGAHAVVELPAGVLSRVDTIQGDILEVGLSETRP
jgi:uncharacterized membrane protein (UPF0127 family)